MTHIRNYDQQQQQATFDAICAMSARHAHNGFFNLLAYLNCSCACRKYTPDICNVTQLSIAKTNRERKRDTELDENENKNLRSCLKNCTAFESCVTLQMLSVLATGAKTIQKYARWLQNPLCCCADIAQIALNVACC